ncbi:MAG TPA: hypothetical protein DC047_05155 [Blastocatellia bacterium]|nr:hypothetical protein [Blastocatellia bacterium]
MTTSAKKSLFAIANITVFLTGCALLSRSVKTDQEFVMKSNDKVTVSGTGLEIELEAVGHQTSSNAQSRPISSFFVKMTIISGGQSRSIEIEDSVEVGDYTIKVKSANPFASGGGPNCSLLVTRR